MPTTDELQSQINALQTQLNSILGMADDDYIHQYSGEEIDAGITAAGKAVRYDLAQSLTAAQQTQARGNIAAAPDGYGLGAVWNVAPSRDADLITGSGFQMAVLNTPTGNSWWGILSFIYDADTATQWAMPQNTAAYYGSVCKREKRAGTWTPWEWVNPPLALGVEYRTTERYLGKPVYCKLVNCGEIAGDKTVAHGISSMSRCIFAQGNYLGAIIPMIVNRSLSDTRTVYISSVSNTAITIICGANITGGTCYVQVKYTKTTD